MREDGAEKTTPVKLCRMYQPAAGRILVDGVELSTIFFDEPAASLDAPLAPLLHRALRRPDPGGGRVWFREPGSHDELILRDGLYAGLYQLQARAYA